MSKNKLDKKSLPVATWVSTIIFLCLVIPAPASAQDKVILPDQAGDYMRGLYHVGLWVEDMDEMLSFLAETTDFKVLSRVKRRGGGERLFLEDRRGQRLELLSAPGKVRPHAAYPLHPKGQIAGVAHISIEVDDIIPVKDKLTTRGYEVLAQFPANDADGYIVSEVKAHRVLFIKGPSSVSFEFFEIED